MSDQKSLPAMINLNPVGNVLLTTAPANVPRKAAVPMICYSVYQMYFGGSEEEI